MIHFYNSDHLCNLLDNYQLYYKRSFCLRGTWIPLETAWSQVVRRPFFFVQGKGTGIYEQCYYGPQKQYRVTKLSPASRYAFRLAAKNDMGVRSVHLPDYFWDDDDDLSVVVCAFFMFDCYLLCFQWIQWSGGPVHLLQRATATLPSRARKGRSHMVVSKVAETH